MQDDSKNFVQISSGGREYIRKPISNRKGCSQMYACFRRGRCMYPTYPHLTRSLPVCIRAVLLQMRWIVLLIKKLIVMNSDRNSTVYWSVKQLHSCMTICANVVHCVVTCLIQREEKYCSGLSESKRKYFSPSKVIQPLSHNVLLSIYCNDYCYCNYC